MASALERAARAVQDEIERQIAAIGYLGWGLGQDENRPNLGKTYVDGDLDVSSLARSVLMAVRELPDEILNEHLYDKEYGYAMYYEGWQPAIDAILNEKDATND